MQRCYGGMVLDWLYCHPCRTVACRLESEANYVARAFERFWEATALTQNVEFTTLAAALQYLRACLNGAILNTLRNDALSRELLLPEAGEPRKPQVEETTDRSEVWEILQTMLPDEREKRLAYLSFHCGLKPREIMRLCPQEFRDLHEIYQPVVNYTFLLSLIEKEHHFFHKGLPVRNAFVTFLRRMYAILLNKTSVIVCSSNESGDKEREQSNEAE